MQGLVNKGINEFMIDQVKGPVKTVENIVIQLGETKMISGMVQFKGNSRRINLVTEPVQELQEIENPDWVTIPSYSECKGGSSRVSIAVRNVSKKVVVIMKGQQIADVTAANQVPNMLAPKYVDRIREDDPKKGKFVSSKERRLGEKRKAQLWEQLDISGADDWAEEHKQSIKETFEDFYDVFALNPMELGRTSLVQHNIKITDPKPFKERYREDTSSPV